MARAHQRIGFVGLGMMGWHMASSLTRAGHQLVVSDANLAVAERFVAIWPTAAVATPDGTGFADVSAVVIMLPNGDAVRDVLLGRAGAPGLVCRLPAGTLVIDMGSSDPSVYGDVAKTLHHHGIDLIDAPVSGNVAGAEAATLTIMAGGDAHLVELARPLLLAMGSTVFHTGPLGTGQAMKALNNLVSATGLMIAVEALLVGQRLGLDPRQMNDILNVSTGRNNSTERKIAPFVLSGSYNSGFRLGLMAKDLRAAAAIAQREGMATDLGRRCLEMVEDALAQLGPDADHTEVARHLEGRTGEAFRHFE